MDDGRAVLQRSLGYLFHDPSLLQLALTHRSHTSEVEGEVSNERLEFLGDAVLGLVVAEELYRGFGLPEGEMAKTRAEVVDEASLAQVAASLGLGDHLLLGGGEDVSGGREKASILADALEAVVGAIFVDGGLGSARAFVLGRWDQLLAVRAAAPGVLDSKTRLQETLALDGLLPEYEVEGFGPDHERSFRAIVACGGKILGVGAGTSKKRAEQEAARVALETIGTGPDA